MKTLPSIASTNSSNPDAPHISEQRANLKVERALTAAAANSATCAALSLAIPFAPSTLLMTAFIAFASIAKLAVQNQTAPFFKAYSLGCILAAGLTFHNYVILAEAVDMDNTPLREEDALEVHVETDHLDHAFVTVHMVLDLILIAQFLHLSNYFQQLARHRLAAAGRGMQDWLNPFTRQTSFSDVDCSSVEGLSSLGASQSTESRRDSFTSVADIRTVSLRPPVSAVGRVVRSPGRRVFFSRERESPSVDEVDHLRSRGELLVFNK